MPKIVNVPDVGNVEFPDEMPDEQIGAVLSKTNFTPPSKTGTEGRALLDHAINRAPLGLGDEMEAGWKSIAKKLLPQSMGGAPPGAAVPDMYRGERDRLRGELAQEASEYPNASRTGDIVGAVAPALIPFGAASGAPRALGIGQRLLRSIGTGGAYGAASAFGNSDAEGAQLAKETAMGGAAGAAVAGGATALSPIASAIASKLRASIGAPVSEWLSSKSTDIARRFLSGTQSGLASKVPLSDAAVEEAFAQGAIKPLSTIESASAKLQSARDAVGEQYAQTIAALEKAGIRGPEADALAKQFANKAAEVDANTMQPGVSKAYESAGARLLRLTKPKPISSLANAPAAPGAAPVSNLSAYQDSMNANPKGDLATLLTARASPAAGSPLTPAAAGPLGTAPLETAPIFLPDSVRMPNPQPLGISALAKQPPGGEEALSDALNASPRLTLTQAENLKRSLQDKATGAYQRVRSNELGDANKDAASMLRAAVEKSVDDQAALAPEAAANFVPVKQQLSRLIPASDAANATAARMLRNHVIGLKETTLAAGDPGKLLLAALLKGRGTSTAAAAARGGANFVDSAFDEESPKLTRAALAAFLQQIQQPQKNQ